MSIATGQVQRHPFTVDGDLLQRALGSAAIATVSGTIGAPNWAGALVNFKDGEVFGRLIIDVEAVTLDAANDTAFRFAILGYNSSDVLQATLAEIIVGCTEISFDLLDLSAGQRIVIPFTNASRGDTTGAGIIYPKVKAVLVSTGTSASITFGATFALDK